MAEGRARPLSLTLSEGQRSDSKRLSATLDAVRVPRCGRGRPRKRPGKVRLDKGYSYPRIRRWCRRRQIEAVIPTRSNQPREEQFDKETYQQRHLIEQVRLNHYRLLAHCVTSS